MQCTERETEEETGLKVKAVSLLTATNDIFEAEGKHYITLFVRCHMTDPNDKPQVRIHLLNPPPSLPLS